VTARVELYYNMPASGRGGVNRIGSWVGRNCCRKIGYWVQSVFSWTVRTLFLFLYCCSWV